MVRPNRDHAVKDLSTFRKLCAMYCADIAFALGNFKGGPWFGAPYSIRDMYSKSQPEITDSEKAEELDSSLGLIGHRMKEILAAVEGRTRMGGVRLLGWVLGKLWRLVFKSIFVDAQGVERARASFQKAADSKTPVMLLPTHRSHVDYLLMSYIAFGFNLPVPHIAAGDNLNIPLIGPLFSYTGAFFIRRSFRGDNLYKKVLFRYILSKLQEGAPVEVFVEGGRTRTGMINKPKVGMILMAVRFIRDGSLPDCLLLPASIDYERVVESEGYANQLLGTKKKSESLLHVMKSGYNLLSGKNSYGSVYANFASAISVRNIMDKVELEYNRSHKEDSMNTKLYVPEEIIVEAVGEAVVTAQRSVSYITPVALVSASLLGLPDFSMDDVLPMAKLLSDLCTISGGNVSPEPVVLDDILHILDPVLGAAFSVTRENAKYEDMARRRLRLRYCCGQLIPFLAPHAVICTAYAYQPSSVIELAKDISELIRHAYPGADLSEASLLSAYDNLADDLPQGTPLTLVLRMFIAPSLFASLSCARAAACMLEESGEISCLKHLTKKTHETILHELLISNHASFPEALSNFEVSSAVTSFSSMMLVDTEIAEEVNSVGTESPTSSISVVSIASSMSFDPAASTPASTPRNNESVDVYKFYSSLSHIGSTLKGVLATLGRLQLQGKTPGVTSALTLKPAVPKASKWKNMKLLLFLGCLLFPFIRLPKVL